MTAAVRAEAQAKGISPEGVELAVTRIRAEAQLALRDWAAQHLEHASASDPIEIALDDFLQARLDPSIKDLLRDAHEASGRDQAG